MELENERVLGLELEGKYTPELAGNKKMLKTIYLVDKQDKIIKTKFMKYDGKQKDRIYSNNELSEPFI